MRSDHRPPNELRETTITANYLIHAEGSVLISAGNTRVICTASVEDRVPGFLRNTGKGWVTAEYGMLPRATGTRMQREASAGKVGGRTQEIQRLIGRSLRSVTNLTALGERTVWIDCDVIQADGGTRTASITGAFVATTGRRAPLELVRAIISTPVGDMLTLASGDGLCALEFTGPGQRLTRLEARLQRHFPPHAIVDGESSIVARTRQWLDAYF